jgi:hypothetical protein
VACDLVREVLIKSRKRFLVVIPAKAAIAPSLARGPRLGPIGEAGIQKNKYFLDSGSPASRACPE